MATETMRTLAAEPVVEGVGAGPLLYLDAPLSFWGGLDAASGRIVEKGHPQEGRSVAGTVLVMRAAKGSSSSSSVLAEAIRNGHGPGAIVMGTRDLIVGLGCIVAAELYGACVPVVQVDDAVLDALRAMRDDGHVRFHVRADEGSAVIQAALTER